MSEDYAIEATHVLSDIIEDNSELEVLKVVTERTAKIEEALAQTVQNRTTV